MKNLSWKICCLDAIVSGGSSFTAGSRRQILKAYNSFAIQHAFSLLMPSLYPNRQSFILAGIIPHWALLKKSHTVSNLPSNGPRAPSPQSTPVHTNYKTARTQIEAFFSTGCAGTTKDLESLIPLQLFILFASTHLFHLLAPYHREWAYLDLPGLN